MYNITETDIQVLRLARSILDRMCEEAVKLHSHFTCEDCKLYSDNNLCAGTIGDELNSLMQTIAKENII